jgi:hypothetical protein
MVVLFTVTSIDDSPAEAFMTRSCALLLLLPHAVLRTIRQTTGATIRKREYPQDFKQTPPNKFFVMFV